MSIDLSSDFYVLAATLDGEAEGEVLVGKQAVAASVMNRVKLAAVHPHFGDGTIRGACLANQQFSCWLPGPDRDRIEALDFENPSPALAECMGVVSEAIHGSLVDLTGGSTHYFSPTIPAPAWVAGARWCGQFGKQLFWRGVK